MAFRPDEQCRWIGRARRGDGQAGEQAGEAGQVAGAVGAVAQVDVLDGFGLDAGLRRRRG